MTSWIRSYTDALTLRLGSHSELPVDNAEASLLELARDVAHTTERANAPLAAFAAGWYVAERMREGVTAEGALVEAREIARELLTTSE